MDDVIFEEEAQNNEEFRWMALVRVYTEKTYSQTAFFKTMCAAWDLAKETRFRPLELNLFSIKFNCLGEWEKAMEGGPWNFRGNPVLLAEYDGFTKPSSISLNTFDIWMQIHDLSDGYLVA